MSGMTDAEHDAIEGLQLRVNEKGWRTFVRPAISLVHDTVTQTRRTCLAPINLLVEQGAINPEPAILSHKAVIGNEMKTLFLRPLLCRRYICCPEPPPPFVLGVGLIKDADQPSL